VCEVYNKNISTEVLPFLNWSYTERAHLKLLPHYIQCFNRYHIFSSTAIPQTPSQFGSYAQGHVLFCFVSVKPYNNFTRNGTSYSLRLTLHHISHFFFFSPYKHSNSKELKKITYVFFRQSIWLLHTSAGCTSLLLLQFIAKLYIFTCFTVTFYNTYQWWSIKSFIHLAFVHCEMWCTKNECFS
jgi:hypothetical protein